MLVKTEGSKKVLIAANLVGISAITYFHPYIKYAESPWSEWLYMTSLPIAAAALCYGAYALAFRERARGGWPVGFLVLAWLFAVSNVASVLVSKKAAPAPIHGWTQESTRSADKGPWLDYTPQGARFCRTSDGNIATVFPPGMKPDAEKADPACLSASVPSARQL